jgi:hypothetical protein
MKTLLKYAVGGILVITAISSLVYGLYGVIGSVPILIAAFVCFPPLTEILKNKTGVTLLPAIKYVVVISFPILGFMITTNSKGYIDFQKKQAELTAIEKKEDARKDSVNSMNDKQKNDFDNNGNIDTPKEDEVAVQDDKTELVKIGDLGRIIEPCVGGISKDVNSEISKIAINHDYEAIEEFVRAGQALPLEKNTKIRVTDSGWGYQKVRILSGQFKGYSLFVFPSVVGHL